MLSSLKHHTSDGEYAIAGPGIDARFHRVSGVIYPCGGEIDGDVIPVRSREECVAFYGMLLTSNSEITGEVMSDNDFMKEMDALYDEKEAPTSHQTASKPSGIQSTTPKPHPKEEHTVSRPQSRRRIIEALEHYRCPSCAGPADFSQREISVTSWTYNVKKARWCFDDCESLDEHGIDPHDIDPYDCLDDVYEVRCDKCDHGVTWPDGSPVSAVGNPGFHEWLAALADKWERQKVEREKLAVELEEAKQGLPPVGTIVQLEARLKVLETVSTFPG